MVGIIFDIKEEFFLNKTHQLWIGLPRQYCLFLRWSTNMNLKYPKGREAECGGEEFLSHRVCESDRAEGAARPDGKHHAFQRHRQL